MADDLLNLPPTGLVAELLQQTIDGARNAAPRSGDIAIADKAAIDELGRILARCMVRDAMAGRQDRIVALLRLRADNEDTDAGGSPRAAVILRHVAEEVARG